jgi:hypothetical protein
MTPFQGYEQYYILVDFAEMGFVLKWVYTHNVNDER